MKKKILRTACSFLMITLHAMLFGAVQNSETLVSTQKAEHWELLKGLLYVVGISLSFLHPYLTNRLGLRRILTLGLLADALGFLCFVIQLFWYSPYAFILPFLGAVFFGAGSLSVLNCLIIYIIWDYPKNTVMGITALIAFANIGFFLDIVLGSIVNLFEHQTELFLFLIALLLFFTAIVSIIYEDPPYPEKVKHLRSGTLLWKEMHQRLFLFLLAVILYGATEATFNFWGGTFLENRALDFEIPISFFWIAMVLGQFFLLIPLSYGSPYKILFGKVGIVVLALLILPHQSHHTPINFSFFLGGLGCSGIFPILLALLEVELIHISLISRYNDYLPLIDTAISIMTAGYLFGIAFIDFWTGPFFHPNTHLPFTIGAGFILICCGLLAYLHRTRLIKMK